MITSKILDIFQRYDGDIDAWLRLRTAKERLVMSEHDWHLIEKTIQEIGAIKSGYASVEYITSVSNKLKSVCEDINTLDRITKMAGITINQLIL